MGHFSHTCKLTGLPITGGTPVVLFPLKMRKDLYEYSDKQLRKYGTTYQCSNDTTMFKFQPVWFPIYGDYDDYGGIENIIEDDNTKILEDYYGLTIQEICNVLTSGRKDDGYDDNLSVIKDPDKDDEYGSPNYKERYKELLSISGMWIHRDVFMKLTEKSTDNSFDKLDLGTPEILNALGFTEIEEDKEEQRYKRRFEKDGLVLNSDGTWLHQKDESWLYDIEALEKYCKKHGVDIDISTIGPKDRMEQLYDYIVPTVESIGQYISPVYRQLRNQYTTESSKIMEEKFGGFPKSEEEREEFRNLPEIVEIRKKLDDLKNEYNVDEDAEFKRYVGGSGDHMRHLYYRFLNGQGEYEIKNPLTPLYFESAKNGGLRDNMVRFWRFDWYMYCTGTYYDLAGTAPQDGEHKAVMNVLKVAQEVLQPRIAEIEEWEKEYEDEEA